MADGWTPGCAIDGACVGPGATRPANPCESCQPALNGNGWSILADGASCDDGTPCGLGASCAGGACKPVACDDQIACTTDTCNPATGQCGHVVDGACLIDGECVPAGALDPANPCASCQPGESTAVWSALDATPCPGDPCKMPGTCAAGACVSSTVSKLQGWTSDEPGTDRFSAAAAVPGGGLVAAGAVGGESSVVRFDDAGALLWDMGYGSGSLYGVVVRPEGGFALSGVNLSTTPGGIWILGIDAAGAEEWSHTFGGDSGSRLVAAPDGGYAVTGRKDAQATLVRTDEVGQEQWTRSYLPATWLAGIVNTNDGGFAMVGSTVVPGSTLGLGDAVLVRTGPDGAPLFVSRYGANDGHHAYDLVQTAGGGFVVVGRTDQNDQDMLMFATDAAGSLLWRRVIEEPEYAAALRVLALPDGGFLVSGVNQLDGVSTFGAGIWRTDSTGRVVWQKTFSDKHSVSAEIVPLSNDRLAMVGQRNGEAPAANRWVEILDAWGHADCEQAKACADLSPADCDDKNPCTDDVCLAGACSSWPTTADCVSTEPCTVRDACVDGECVPGQKRLFLKTPASPAAQQGRAIVPLPDGGAVVAGITTAAGGLPDGLLTRFNAAGAIEWSEAYGGTGADSFQAVLRTPGGHLVAAGTNGSTPQGALWLLATDSVGELVWQQQVDAGSGTALVATTDGGVVAVTETGAAARIGWNGALEWSADQAAPDTTTRFYGVTNAGDGGFVAVGDTVADGAPSDASMVAFDSTGTALWSRTHGGEGADSALAVESVPGGLVFVGTTQAADGTDPDGWLVHTNPAGLIVWERTLAALGDDLAAGLSKSPDGGFLLAGQTTAPAGIPAGWLIQTDALGQVAWERALETAGGGALLDVAPVAGGGLLAAGSGGVGEASTLWLMRLDHAGHLSCAEAGPCAALTCSDDDLCTLDTCNPETGCTFSFVISGECDDGEPCTVVDSCVGAGCQPGTSEPSCDDGDTCTTDLCEPGTGCQNSPVPCDDGNPCTGDACEAGAGCISSPLVDGAACPDDDPCDGEETCQAGECHTGEPPVCDDGLPCNGVESCVPGVGCTAGAPPDPTSFVEVFDNAPDYTNNWELSNETGSVVFDYTPGALHVTAAKSPLSGASLRALEPMVGETLVYAIDFYHAGYGRTMAEVLSEDGTLPLAGFALDTNDTNFLNVNSYHTTVGPWGTDSKHLGTPYMNRWVLMEIVVTNGTLYFFVDGAPLEQVDLGSQPQATRLQMSLGSAPWKSGPNDTTFASVYAKGICGPRTDDCVGFPDTVPCDDGDQCTEQDACAGAICSGTPIAGCVQP